MVQASRFETRNHMADVATSSAMSGHSSDTVAPELSARAGRSKHTPTQRPQGNTWNVMFLEHIEASSATHAPPPRQSTRPALLDIARRVDA